MTNPTPSARAARFAALFAVAVLLLGSMPAHAASAVEIDARALVGGRYQVGGWLGVTVTLVNEGAPTDGQLVARTVSGETRRRVEMPSGARKEVTLYVQPEAFQREVEVRYEEPNGTVRDVVEVRVLEQAAGQIAIVGDGDGTLRPQLLGDGQFTRVEPISFSPADIPQRPEPLAGVSAIVWAGDSNALGAEQRRSLERWIGSGGQLVVIGGPDWQARAGGFTDLLPLTDLAAVDGVSQAPIAAWAGGDAPALAEASVSTGTLRPDARAFIVGDRDLVLGSMRPIGAGRVVYFGADLAEAPYRAWESAPRLWERVLPTGTLFEQFFGVGIPAQEEIDNSLAQALTTLPSLDVPPAELLLAVIVAYILLIGPGSYLVLRRLDRRELAWVTAPILVIVFSASSFGIGRALKGTDVLVNQVALLRSVSDGSAASVETYAGIYSPDRSSFDITAEGDALMGRLLATFRPPGQAGAGNVTSEQGDPGRLRDLTVGVSGFEAVRALGLVEHEPALSLSWSFEDGNRVGTVTNVSDEPVADVAWISTAGAEMVGDLGPGESGQFEVPAMNFNGSAASDQLYGFGGFDASSDEQRAIQLRRQIVDALVGYGGFPLQVETGGRGPFVIGWRNGDGPLPVTLDDRDARRFSTLVEVLAARPPLGTGAVTVRPHQMAISVISSEGDASTGGPGNVFLNSGSVTWTLALPLEAAGLEPTAVDIVVGTDPGMFLQNEGGFMGMWPPGITLEVRDPRTGAWMPVGDIAEGTHFEVDPEAALTDAGRIDVRVTSEADPAWGGTNLLLSAQVEGVIAP